MWVKRTRRAGALLAAVAVMAAATGCGLLNKEEPLVMETYVTGVQVLNDAAESQQFVREQLGSGEEDGPAAVVQDVQTVVNGGSAYTSVTAEAEFTTVRLALEGLPSPTEPSPGDATEGDAAEGDAADGEEAAPAPDPTSTGAPAPGYHEIKLREPSTVVDLVLTVSQALPSQLFVLYFAVVDASGKQGPLATQSVEAVAVGTGQVQVSVSWDVDSDVDLHVVEPTGEEIYYGKLTSSAGGTLDLDSNANCSIDGKRNENIVWKDSAPPGVYTVRVDLYTSCEVEPTNYVVTVQVAGQPTRTFTGVLTGSGDEGAEGSGVEVATFEVTAPESNEEG